MGILDRLSKPLRDRLSEELELLLREEKQAGAKAVSIKTVLDDRAQIQAQQLLNQARQEAEKIRQEALRIREEADRRLGAVEEREKVLTTRLADLEKRLGEVKRLKGEQLAKLEKIASLTAEEAQKLVLEMTEKRLANRISRRIKEAEEEIRVTADARAKQILVDAMQHGATDYVVEYTVSSLHLADEEMKGRIIGREGRNIRAFERATGVEIEFDESNDILLSSFDPVRREVARRVLEKLIRDRRIQPSRIEEVVEKTQQEVEKMMFEEGENLCHGLGVYRLPPDLVKLLGRFKFRFSYGQNMMVHTLEETKIGIQIADEVGANVNVVRLGCLLHDIGKVITEEEGTHVQLGVDLARRYGLPEEVINCIAEHHEDKPFSTPESRIVWVADAISGGRPGARYEAHQEYSERMEEIEKIAKEFDGVEETFAYQAGRDVRVMVKPEEISDEQMIVLVDKITRALEERASYAGQIKVTGIRETRAFGLTKAK
jgi:ribonuclease Y